jgi:hypothetical protein
LLGVLALCLPVLLHFFETFPNGWDQAEYVWCVKAGYLPHSPYVLFVLLGRLIHGVLEPATSLSVLSLVSGAVALVAIHGVVSRLVSLGDSAVGDSAVGDSAKATAEARWVGCSAALLLGLSTVFVRLTTTQEVYAFQLGLVLATAGVLVSESRRRLRWAGLLYGCALAAHNSSVFLLPALALLALPKRREAGVVRPLVVWLGYAVLSLGFVYAIGVSLLPAEPGRRLAEVAAYLRGMPPGFEVAALGDTAGLLEAARGIARRLGSGDIAVTRGPLATGPVGASWLHAVAAVAGGAVLLRVPRVLGFWLLWVLPFLAYELALGWNLDYGVYLVFVMPPLAALCASGAAWLGGLRPPSSRLAQVLLVLLLLLPSATQIARHWEDPLHDRRRHDSEPTLAAAWAARSLPEDAIVIQSRREWNSNLLPLYAERQHVARTGSRLRLFRDRGPWTPMKPEVYEPLTTRLLQELLRAGRPVFAFEPDPLRDANPGSLDPTAFVWQPAGAADLGSAAVQLGLSTETKRRFEGRSLDIYRGQEATP